MLNKLFTFDKSARYCLKYLHSFITSKKERKSHANTFFKMIYFSVIYTFYIWHPINILTTTGESRYVKLSYTLFVVIPFKSDFRYKVMMLENEMKSCYHGYNFNIIITLAVAKRIQYLYSFIRLVYTLVLSVFISVFLWTFIEINIQSMKFTHGVLTLNEVY